MLVAIVIVIGVIIASSVAIVITVIIIIVYFYGRRRNRQDVKSNDPQHNTIHQGNNVVLTPTTTWNHVPQQMSNMALVANDMVNTHIDEVMYYDEGIYCEIGMEEDDYI